MGKLLIFLILILGIIVFFFKGATKLILALTGFKKANNQPSKENNIKNKKAPINTDVLYEKGETKVFKGMAGNKQKEK